MQLLFLTQYQMLQKTDLILGSSDYIRTKHNNIVARKEYDEIKQSAYAKQDTPNILKPPTTIYLLPPWDRGVCLS